MTNSLADRATSEMLIGPDWALNLEICDILNHDPGQARDFVKGLKKRIISKNPKVQLLTLTLLETVVKNCGNMVHMHIADKDIPHVMVKIVKKKPDFHVKEKILVLIDSWHEAFGGPQGRYPQFFIAYLDLLRAGVVFPKKPVKSTPILNITEPRSSKSHLHTLSSQDKKIEKLEASNDSEVLVLSLADIQNARSIIGILADIVNALELGHKEGAKQEVIAELVEQCRIYRQRVVHLVNSTSDEELLCHGLSLNDDLQNVLLKYSGLIIGASRKSKKQKSFRALVDINVKNPEGDGQLDQKSIGDRSTNNEAPLQQILLPAPSVASGLPVDLLSSDEFGAVSIDNSSALVSTNEAIVPSANEQNILALSDMFSLAEEAYTVASQFHPEQQSQPCLVYEPPSFDPSWNDPNLVYAQRQQACIGAADQSGALPPPPWEIELAASNSQPLASQEQREKIRTYSPRTQGAYQPQNQAYYISGSYSQSGQCCQMTTYNYAQQSDSQLYGYNNASFPYSNPSELSNKMYGLSLKKDECLNSSYLGQPMKQMKDEENLFSDLVSMAKTRQNQPAK